MIEPTAILAPVSGRIAETLGLHFPPERWPDLRRGLKAAAGEFGFTGVADFGEWLLSATLTPQQLQSLASHLTVGETYFFRDKAALQALSEHVLPELIASRRGRFQRLRFWSAACCTGEEPYTLAILLSQLLPDIAEWHISILATDINARFLEKAAAGLYGEWSFRETPPAAKARYFRRLPDGRYALVPEIRGRVSFANLNLVDDSFPSLATGTNAMDLILCRNALMYFTPAQARKAVVNLQHSLVREGWLVVSPAEVSQAMFPGFTTVNFPGAVIYRKGQPVEAAVAPLVPEDLALPPEPLFRPPERPAPAPAPPAPIDHSLVVRTHANEGRLDAALAASDQWLAEDKLDPAAHHLRAIVLQELGDRVEARRSLQRAIYLDPAFALAHFALGHLARAEDRLAESGKHFGNALAALRTLPPEEALPQSDGLTAGRLAEIIGSLLSLQSAT
jgi:chemotaxis protein methyltransferase CheR